MGNQQERPAPALTKRLGEAIFILAMGSSNVGGMRPDLMWPYPPEDYTLDDTRRAAARLVASVYTVLLEALPPAQIERISKDLDAYLSFVHGDGWPDDKGPSPAAGSSAPE